MRRLHARPLRASVLAVAALALLACDDSGVPDASDALLLKETPATDIPGDAGWCGDGRADEGEDCDDDDLDGADCNYLGFGDGLLRCASDCAFDTSLCLGNDVCGNGVVDGDEECDDGDVLVTDCAYGESSCEVCTAECTVGAGVTHTCGDDVLDGLEQCDGEHFGDDDCVSLGYDGGDIACGDDCRLDTTTCVGAVCGNGVVDDGEDCDDGNSNAADCEYGVESCQLCRTDCTFGDGAAHFCGDGVIDATGGEPCDGAALGGATCESHGFVGGGTLACTAVDDGTGRMACFPDLSGCDTGAGAGGGGSGGGCASAPSRMFPSFALVAAAVALVGARRRSAPAR